MHRDHTVTAAVVDTMVAVDMMVVVGTLAAGAGTGMPFVAGAPDTLRQSTKQRGRQGRRTLPLTNSIVAGILVDTAAAVDTAAVDTAAAAAARLAVPAAGGQDPVSVAEKCLQPATVFGTVRAAFAAAAGTPGAAVVALSPLPAAAVAAACHRPVLEPPSPAAAAAAAAGSPLWT